MLSVGLARSSELKGIVSYDGYWKTFPKIKGNGLLSGYSKEDVLEFISDRCPAIGCFYKLNELDLDLIYNNIFNEESFFYDEVVLNNCIGFPCKVRFCYECFREQIFHYGVSYFKVEWYNSCKCSVHNVNLLDVKASKVVGNKRLNVYSIIDLAMKYNL
ncbi:hypothetical protein GNT65_16745 [Shewanella sp. JBTF-M18]|uniref:Uncharacterized protein n=1 Tax=Shewanella insulae TaxID=2681496 RepID=A0A6L7I4K1_9GAMM|nr:hypothetical protein [Shewanella insulae]MXR70308.1 hypothetical protein [Shewanella insulae]